MRKSTWKKLVSFMLVAALIIGSVHLSNNRVKADETDAYYVDEKKDETSNASLKGTLKTVPDDASDVTLTVDYNNAGVDPEQTYSDVKAAIVVVVDLSDSMRRSQSIGLTEDAVKALVKSVLDSEYGSLAKVALVTYNTPVTVVSDFSGSATEINNKVHFSSNNGTNTLGALEKAADLLSSDSVNANNKIIVLLSDGMPNTCEYAEDDPRHENGFEDNSEETIASANTIKNSSIQIYTIGYNVDETTEGVLKSIATTPKTENETYYFPATNTNGAGTSLLTAFGKVADELGEKIKASNEKLAITLTDGILSFDADTNVTVANEEPVSASKDYKVYVKKTADELAKDYLNEEEGTVEFVGVDSIVLSYVFNGEPMTLTLNNLKVKAKVENWKINYYFEEADKVVETTRYEFTKAGFVPSVSKDDVIAAFDKAVTEFSIEDYIIDAYTTTRVEGKNEIDVKIPLWNAKFVFYNGEYGTENNTVLDEKDIYLTTDADKVNAPEGPAKENYKFTGWEMVYVVEDQRETTKVETISFEDAKSLFFENIAEIDDETVVEFYPTYEEIPAEEPVLYTLTVKYVYSDGTQAYADKTSKLEAGADYAVEIPAKEGYTAKADADLTGKMPADDVTITITYTAIPKEDPKPVDVTVTVKYEYTDGTKAADDKTATNVPGKNYSIESPAIEGYTPSDAVISGIIPEKDVTITVTYTKNQPKQEDPTPTPEQKKNDPPIIYYVADPTPVPTADPTPVPTADPTPEPTQVPEEIEEAPEVPENVEVEIPETPEGEPEEIEIPEEPETPEGTPDDIEVELPDVPEGLPQTGTAPVAVFFGIGAACIILGGAMIVKIRRREEEM